MSPPLCANSRIGLVLVQREGVVVFHHDLLASPSDNGLGVRAHNGELRDVQIYANTVILSGSSIRVSGESAGYT